MKCLQVTFFVLLVSILSFNCQKELSTTGPGTVTTDNNLSAPVTATLQGNILDETGQPAEGVQITVGSKTASTNASGYFRIVNASLDKNASLIVAEKPGYFKALRTFSATSGVNQVAIKLTKKTLAGSVKGTNGGEVALSNGTKIALPVNGIVKEADGSTYAGDVNIYAAYIDPSARDINESVPGSFMANDKNNQRVTLKSFGMVAVVLESSSGEKLQIAKNYTAKLTIPIPSGLQSAAPTTISLWYVDEKTGIWKEEGTATKTGTNYIGDVKHFSYWNSDFSEPGVVLSMTLKNTLGQPIIYANVVVRATGGGSAHGFSDSLGQVRGLVPANENLTLEVVDECGMAVYSQNIAPLSQYTNLGDITVGSTTSSIVTLQGKLTDCNNVPLTKGYAIIYYDNITRYAAVSTSGDFSLTFISCAGNQGVFEILGVDEVTQQQGTVTPVTISFPVTNAGNISACGTSALEFINYKVDGVDYTISRNSVADSLIAFTSPGPGSLLTTAISGSASNNSNIISFSFINNGAAGVFAMSYLSVIGMNNTELVQPFNVDLTNYPQNTGEFFEGSLSGQFRDASDLSVLHNISGSFRLRKY